MLVRTTIAGIVLTISSFVNAQITLDALSSIIVCPGELLDVSITSSDTYSAGNSFIVELSDQAGSFAAPVMIGSFSSTVPGTISCNAMGIANGTGYHVRVRSTMPALISAASVEVLSFPNPNAGMDGTISVCGTSGSIDVSTLLIGQDPGGIWTVISGTGVFVDPVNGIYTGLTVGANVFQYTVTVSGCSDSSTITINMNEPPNAGTNATLTVCSNSAVFSLFASLGGAPDQGGTWAAPNGVANQNIFNPAIDIPGIYNYTVMGQAPCVNATSHVLVSVNAAPNAGTNSSHTLCTSDGTFVLFSELQGSPDVGGTWSFNTLPHNPIYDPATDGSGTYVYTVLGASPCLSASSTLTVQENNCVNVPGEVLYEVE